MRREGRDDELLLSEIRDINDLAIIPIMMDPRYRNPYPPSPSWIDSHRSMLVSDLGSNLTYAEKVEK